MHDIRQLKETIRGILDSQKLSVLATLGDGKPYGSLVAFAATTDLKSLLFATARATRKYCHAGGEILRGELLGNENMRLVSVSVRSPNHLWR